MERDEEVADLDRNDSHPLRAARPNHRKNPRDIGLRKIEPRPYHYREFWRFLPLHEAPSAVGRNTASARVGGCPSLRISVSPLPMDNLLPAGEEIDDICPLLGDFSWVRIPSPAFFTSMPVATLEQIHLI
jgi:hypothetical protein